MSRRVFQRATAALLLASVSLACTSSTVISTTPAGARVFLDGAYVGRTPYVMSDTRIVGSATSVRIEADGYEPLQATIRRDEEFSVGACIGGVFLLVPFLWIMGYRPEHTYLLRPAGTPPSSPWPQPAAPPQPGPQPAPQPPPAR
jgi:hypothetical protein